MECFNYECEEKEGCDKYKKAACLFRLDKEQAEMIEELTTRCVKCNNSLIPGKQGKKKVNICTKCGGIYDY